MGEPMPEDWVFAATYTVAWPIWAGGYPTQERALAAVNEHESELRSLVAARLERGLGGPVTLIPSWQAGDYRHISGLSPRSPEPNSLNLLLLASSPASKDAPDIASAVEDLAHDIADFVKRRMPGASRGANLYDVVPGWQMGPHRSASKLPEVDDSATPVVTQQRVAGPTIASGAAQPVSSTMASRIRPYRYALTLGQLQQLASSPGNGGEDVIDTYYGWRNDRTAAAVKGMGGAALSLLVAWLVPFLKNEYAKTPLWLVLGPPLLTITALAVWSLIAAVWLNRIHASYAASAALLQIFR